MTALIISIIALVLALYIGFKRKVVNSESKYYFIPDAVEHHPFIKTLVVVGRIKGVYLITETTTSILGKEKVDNYLEFTFYGSKQNKKIYL